MKIFLFLILCTLLLIIQSGHMKNGKEINLDKHLNAPYLMQNQNRKRPISLIDSSTNKAFIKVTTQKKKFVMLDRSSYEHTIECEDGVEIQQTWQDSDAVDFEVFLNYVPLAVDIKHKILVYSMESEPHAGSGDSWKSADFRMYYNLDDSFPGPATYFDMNSFLPDLIAPPKVSFEQKEKSAPMVWLVGNCNAFNKRQVFMGKLMKHINVDSFGGCLNNKELDAKNQVHNVGNIELYAKYKFVIAIENSNCVDYVTEKLNFAVASGSIPIVAGKNGKPDYLRFMPKNSYINIYDYKSIESLVEHLNIIANDEAEYNKYIHFKFNHKYTRADFHGMPLKEIIRIAKTVIDPNEKFFSQIVAKELSVSKECKLAKYLYNTPLENIEHDIESYRNIRPSAELACLSQYNDFFFSKK